jgi:hypothetical protein
VDACDHGVAGSFHLCGCLVEERTT